MVTNLTDGVDWYYLPWKQWMSTTFFDLGLNHINEAEFIDDFTVVIGHSDGGLVFVTYGSSTPDFFSYEREEHELGKCTLILLCCDLMLTETAQISAIPRPW